MGSDQDWNDVDWSGHELSSGHLDSPLALQLLHWDKPAEISGNVWGRNDGWSGEGNFVVTAIAAFGQLA